MARADDRATADAPRRAFGRRLDRAHLADRLVAVEQAIAPSRALGAVRRGVDDQALLAALHFEDEAADRGVGDAGMTTAFSGKGAVYG